MYATYCYLLLVTNTYCYLLLVTDSYCYLLQVTVSYQKVLPEVDPSMKESNDTASSHNLPVIQSSHQAVEKILKLQ